MNRGVRLLESVVLQRRVAWILSLSECDIPNVESASNPPEILHTDMTEDAIGFNSTSGPFFVDSVSTSTISDRYILK